MHFAVVVGIALLWVGLIAVQTWWWKRETTTEGATSTSPFVVASAGT
jgi:hypothetical protein